MLDLILVLAVYTVVILIFVPLEKIGRWQEYVKKQLKRIIKD